MKTRQLTRGLYIATYIGIIIIAVIKIVHKVKGCPCEQNKRRPFSNPPRNRLRPDVTVHSGEVPMRRLIPAAF